MRPRRIACLALFLLLTLLAAANQDVPCGDCQMMSPDAASPAAKNPDGFMPDGAPAHNFVLIEKERQRECVRSLDELSSLVEELGALKASRQKTSARLPQLQKSFKKLSKTVGANCF